MDDVVLNITKDLTHALDADRIQVSDEKMHSMANSILNILIDNYYWDVLYGTIDDMVEESQNKK